MVIRLPAAVLTLLLVGGPVLGAPPPAPEEPSAVVSAAEAAAETTEIAALSFRDDLVDAPKRLWRDLRALPTLRNGIVLGAVGGLSVASRELWDDDVRDFVRDHPRRFGGELNHFLDNSGQTLTQFGGSAALYALSLVFRSETLHETGLDFMHSLAIEPPIVIALKAAVDTERPNGEPRGFPSGHVASTFTVAAVLHENYGFWAGAAGYTWGALVAAHRIDTAKHDLSDVLFGAALGWVVGSTVAANEAPSVGAVSLRPFLDPRSGASGLAVAWGF